MLRNCCPLSLSWSIVYINLSFDTFVHFLWCRLRIRLQAWSFSSVDSVVVFWSSIVNCVHELLRIVFMTYIVNSFILYNFQLYLVIHNHLNRAPSPWGIHLWIFLEVFHYKFSFMYKLYWFPWGIHLWIFLEVFLYEFPSRRYLVCFPT